MLYDPFTYDTLMAGMVLRFEQQPLHPLDGEINIEGQGIYCLLYQGDYEIYSTDFRKQQPDLRWKGRSARVPSR